LKGVGNYLCENFRNYGPVNVYGLETQTGDPANILVTSTAVGLTLTGKTGALVSIAGQGPVGAGFTFDVVPIGAAKSIDLAAVDVRGTLAPFFMNGITEPIPPFFGGALNVTGASAPVNLFALMQNTGATTISGDANASALLSGATALTVTASFYASGLTLHGYNSFAAINSVAIAFVPEPAPIALAGVGAVALGLAGWKGRRKLR
jgi:hypothetical protein